MKLLSHSFVALMAAIPAFAEPVRLHCTVTDTGDNAEIVLDIENRTIAIDGEPASFGTATADTVLFWLEGKEQLLVTGIDRATGRMLSAELGSFASRHTTGGTVRTATGHCSRRF